LRGQELYEVKGKRVKRSEEGMEEFIGWSDVSRNTRRQGDAVKRMRVTSTKGDDV